LTPADESKVISIPGLNRFLPDDDETPEESFDGALKEDDRIESPERSPLPEKIQGRKVDYKEKPLRPPGNAPSDIEEPDEPPIEPGGPNDNPKKSRPQPGSPDPLKEAKSKPPIPIRYRTFAQDSATGVYTVAVVPEQQPDTDAMLVIATIGDDQKAPRLTHVEAWPYMRKRWPIEKHVKDEGKVVRFIESRYFVTQAQSRALLRNGIARLWWTAKVSHDPARDNPYELAAVLLSTLDITQQILERGIGRAPAVLMGFLEFLNRNKELLLTGGDENRIRIRRLAIFLNMHGGVCILDSLSQPQIMAFLETEFARILASENSGQTQASQS
jgi:hypothetical protein